MNIIEDILTKLILCDSDEYLIRMYHYCKDELKENYNLYAIDYEYINTAKNHDIIRKRWRRIKRLLFLIKKEIKKRGIKWDKD